MERSAIRVSSASILATGYCRGTVTAREESMRLEGGCYCGAVRYVAEGEPALRAQCHCRACQHISGGAPNLFMLMPAEGFTYTKGAPKTYTRPDKVDAVTREFCAACGTHMISRRPGLRPVVLKIGTLDDPSVYGGAQKAIFTAEGQPFHLIAEGIPAFEGLPPPRVKQA
jgi:hypothetical protein